MHMQPWTSLLEQLPTGRVCQRMLPLLMVATRWDDAVRYQKGKKWLKSHFLYC